MPRPKNNFPRFCVDKNGRAFTKIAGRFISLGRADSPQSRVRFAEVLEDHAQGLLAETAEKPTSSRAEININEMLVIFA